MSTSQWLKFQATYTIWWLKYVAYNSAEMMAERYGLKLKIVLVLWLIGNAVGYTGLLLILPFNFVLGVSVAVGSYLIDYAYVVIMAKVSWKIYAWLCVVATVEILSLSERIGFLPAATSVAIIAVIIAVAKAFHQHRNKGRTPS